VYNLNNLQRFGMVEFDARKRALSLEETPGTSKSSRAVMGQDWYCEIVCDIATGIRHLAGGEFKTIEVNARHLQRHQVNAQVMGSGFIWLDTGTHDSLLQASHFVAMQERRRGLEVACTNEIAFRARWIMREHLEALTQPMQKNGHGQYPTQLAGSQVF
jgi:glucose-1-phosphate thymidylyltransferase